MSDKARLERIATAIMAGFAIQMDDGSYAWKASDAALHAVKWAKALIAEIDQRPT